MILTRIECFQMTTPIWINIWLWNDAQCLKWHTSGALLFLEVICKISRSHMPKNWRFVSDLSISEWQLQFDFTDGYEMTHVASRGMEEFPYCFSRSSAKFRCHTGWKNNDLDWIWTRLQGRSQLSNPSDLPCFYIWSFSCWLTRPLIFWSWYTFVLNKSL